MERIIVGINYKVYEVEYFLGEFKIWKIWNRIFRFIGILDILSLL